MANIGTFTRTNSGFTGTIRTLTLNVKVNIVHDEHKASDAAPDFRVLAANTVELGAGWKKIAEPQAGAIHTVIVGRRAGTWRRRRS